MYTKQQKTIWLREVRTFPEMWCYLIWVLQNKYHVPREGRWQRVWFFQAKKKIYAKNREVLSGSKKAMNGQSNGLKMVAHEVRKVGGRPTGSKIPLYGIFRDWGFILYISFQPWHHHLTGILWPVMRSIEVLSISYSNNKSVNTYTHIYIICTYSSPPLPAISLSIVQIPVVNQGPNTFNGKCQK